MSYNNTQMTGREDHRGDGPSEAACFNPLWTAVLSACLLIVYFSLQRELTLLISGFISVGGMEAASGRLAVGGAYNGFSFAAASLLAAPLCTLMCFGMVRASDGACIRDYMCLLPPVRKDVLRWCILTLLSMILLSLLSSAADRSAGHDFWSGAYRTAGFVPVLYLAIVVAIPVFEETVFRGFLMAGLRRTALGAIGAVLVTSLCWAAIHFQYDAFGKTNILVLGLLFGSARVVTGSLYVSIAMHMLNNLVSLMGLSILSMR